MIKISELKPSDIGRWIKYHDGVGGIEQGRIKSWNDKYIFVVYKCDNQWDRFEDFTAAATMPYDLEWMEP